jgi:hypothetical protein
MATLAKAKLDARDVIAKAKQWVLDTYADEAIADVGLEEVVLNGKRWNITIGFKRKRIHPVRTLGDQLKNLNILSSDGGYETTLKVVEISDETGEILGMRDRLVS